MNDGNKQDGQMITRRTSPKVYNEFPTIHLKVLVEFYTAAVKFFSYVIGSDDFWGRQTFLLEAENLPSKCNKINEKS